MWQWTNTCNRGEKVNCCNGDKIFLAVLACFAEHREIERGKKGEALNFIGRRKIPVKLFGQAKLLKNSSCGFEMNQSIIAEECRRLLLIIVFKAVDFFTSVTYITSEPLAWSKSFKAVVIKRNEK